MKRTIVLCLISFIGVNFAAQAKSSKSSRGKQTRTRTAETIVSYDAVNDPSIRSAKGTNTLAILRAQILLDRAHFSPGEIDGKPGANLDRAIRAFQLARGIAENAQLDDATWQALNSDTAPAVAPYRLTPEDVAGPFAPIPENLMEQSKLEKLGYQTPVEAIGEQFHISPQLLQQMNHGKTFAAEEEVNVPNVLNPPVGKAARIIVTRSGTLQAFDAEGKIITHVPCSSGSEHDPLPNGDWKITGVARNPPFRYSPELFWDADPSHSKAKIAPGPNNPVGVVWIDLTKEHYGIHGTPEPSSVGHKQSHGCIRLTNWDASAIASLVGPGTPTTLKD